MKFHAVRIPRELVDWAREQGYRVVAVFVAPVDQDVVRCILSENKSGRAWTLMVYVMRSAKSKQYPVRLPTTYEVNAAIKYATNVYAFGVQWDTEFVILRTGVLAKGRRDDRKNREAGS